MNIFLVELEQEVTLLAAIVVLDVFDLVDEDDRLRSVVDALEMIPVLPVFSFQSSASGTCPCLGSRTTSRPRTHFR